MFFNAFRKRVYLDHASAMPVDGRVFCVMKPFFSRDFYNPGGIYREGVAVERILNASRKKVSEFFTVRPEEIIFTSGGTESNNLALGGVLAAWRNRFPNVIPRVITSSIEHASVRNYLRREYQKGGIDLIEIPVGTDGVIDLEVLKKECTKETALISVMYVNNEIGTIEPIRDIAKIVRHVRKENKSAFPLFHTDAIQSIQWCDIAIARLGVDLLSASAAKIYGPKGIACLCVKSGIPFEPPMIGGDQEFAMRPGTPAVPLIVGFAESLEQISQRKKIETDRMRDIQKLFLQEIRTRIPDVRMNGFEADDGCVPCIVNITIPGISSERIVVELDARGVLVSSQSACSSHDPEESYVIKALYGNNGGQDGGVRFSFGRRTRKKDINYAIRMLSEVVLKIKAEQRMLEQRA